MPAYTTGTNTFVSTTLTSSSKGNLPFRLNAVLSMYGAHSLATGWRAQALLRLFTSHMHRSCASRRILRSPSTAEDTPCTNPIQILLKIDIQGTTYEKHLPPSLKMVSGSCSCSASCAHASSASSLKIPRAVAVRASELHHIQPAGCLAKYRYVVSEAEVAVLLYRFAAQLPDIQNPADSSLTDLARSVQLNDRSTRLSTTKMKVAMLFYVTYSMLLLSLSTLEPEAVVL